MDITKQALKYRGAEMGFKRVLKRPEDSLKQKSDEKPRKQQSDEKPSYPVHRSYRYRNLHRAAQNYTKYLDTDLNKKLTHHWQMEMASKLDAAIGFDDDLGQAISVLTELKKEIYSNNCEQADRYDCLRMVQQIASAPDRGWINMPAGEIGKITTYNEMRSYAFLILYDQQRRSGDLNRAKKMHAFLKKNEQQTAQAIPFDVDLERDIDKAFALKEWDVRFLPHHSIRGKVSIFNWVGLNDLPDLIEYLYDTQSSLMPQIVDEIPGLIQNIFENPTRKGLIRNDHKIALPHFNNEKSSFVGWGVHFLRDLQNDDQYTVQGEKAYNEIQLFMNKGVKTLEDMASEVKRTKKEWKALFKPSPKQ